MEEEHVGSELQAAWRTGRRGLSDGDAGPV